MQYCRMALDAAPPHGVGYSTEAALVAAFSFLDRAALTCVDRGFVFWSHRR
jgi:hypothetical protein